MVRVSAPIPPQAQRGAGGAGADVRRAGRAPIPPPVQPLRERSDERAARRDLREQIARLERELQETLVTSFPRTGLDVMLAPRLMAGPRVLGLGELEDLRDRLSAKLGQAREDLRVRVDREQECRRLLERMLLEPGKHRFVKVSNADLGEGGCGVWHVRPRLGLIGMLCGWWQVKLSSGCPLAAYIPDGQALA